MKEKILVALILLTQRYYCNEIYQRVSLHVSLLSHTRKPTTVMPSYPMPSTFHPCMCTQTFIYRCIILYTYIHNIALWALLTLYVALSSSLYHGSSIILKQPPRSVLIPPGALPVHPIHVRIARCNEASYYCRSTALHSSRCTYLPTPVEKSTTARDEEARELPSSSVA